MLFVHGYPYDLFGLFPTDRHLLGVANGRPQDAIFLLGTDQLGRDVCSRLMFATRTSLTIGLVGVALSLVLGVLLGGISGLLRRLDRHRDPARHRDPPLDPDHPAVDGPCRRGARRPGRRQQVYFAITIIISLIGWTELARVVRGRFLALREEDFVTAAELCRRQRSMRIIFRHMVPSFLSATSSPRPPWRCRR